MESITLMWLCARHLSEMAFHEKAGRSQVDSSLASLNKFLFSRRVATVAMLPSALSRSDSFRSVHVGRSQYSRCCHLFGALWFCSCRVEPGPGHLTQSPELGFGLCLFPSWNDFDFVLPFCFMRLPPRSFGCCCGAVRTLLRLPTDDAATPPAFSRSPRSPASFRSFHHARLASVPNA